MVRFITLLTIIYTLVGAIIALVIGHFSRVPALTGGAILGIVNFLLLKKVVFGLPIPDGGNVQKVSLRHLFYLSAAGFLFLSLVLLTGDAVSLLLGYSMFVLALMTFAVKEALHA